VSIEYADSLRTAMISSRGPRCVVKFSRSMLKHSTAPTAVTVEERGSSPMRARSPKNAPWLSVVRILHPTRIHHQCALQRCTDNERAQSTDGVDTHLPFCETLTSPDFIMWKVLPTSPSVMMTWPSLYRSSLHA
jgi:hypothetical protein